MMAITNESDYLGAGRQIVMITKTASFTTIAAQPFTTLDVAGNPGAGSLAIGNTTTGIVPTDATAGFPAIRAFGVGNTGYLASAKYRSNVTAGSILFDRLWHAGSISLTSLATTTFSSQPSYDARLPATDYSAAEIYLEINAAVSNTATTVTVTYTNELGTTGRTAVTTASLASHTNRRLVPIALQAGDKGVQKVESVIVGGVVATTGSFNVVVARRLDDFDVRVANSLDPHAWDMTGGPEVYENSALWLVQQADSTGAGIFSMNMTVLDG